MSNNKIKTVATSIIKTIASTFVITILLTALSFFLFPTYMCIPLILAGSYKLAIIATLKAWAYYSGLFITIDCLIWWFFGVDEDNDDEECTDDEAIGFEMEIEVQNK